MATGTSSSTSAPSRPPRAPKEAWEALLGYLIGIGTFPGLTPGHRDDLQTVLSDLQAGHHEKLREYLTYYCNGTGITTATFTRAAKAGVAAIDASALLRLSKSLTALRDQLAQFGPLDPVIGASRAASSLRGRVSQPVIDGTVQAIVRSILTREEQAAAFGQKMTEMATAHLHARELASDGYAHARAMAADGHAHEAGIKSAEHSHDTSMLRMKQRHDQMHAFGGMLTFCGCLCAVIFLVSWLFIAARANHTSDQPKPKTAVLDLYDRPAAQIADVPINNESGVPAAVSYRRDDYGRTGYYPSDPWKQGLTGSRIRNQGAY